MKCIIYLLLSLSKAVTQYNLSRLLFWNMWSDITRKLIIGTLQNRCNGIMFARKIWITMLIFLILTYAHIFTYRRITNYSNYLKWQYHTLITFIQFCVWCIVTFPLYRACNAFDIHVQQGIFFHYYFARINSCLNSFVFKANTKKYTRSNMDQRKTRTPKDECVWSLPFLFI